MFVEAARNELMDKVQIDTVYARLNCYCIHNKMLYKLYLPILPTAMRARIYGGVSKPNMHSRWMAGIAAYKSGLLLHAQRI